MNASDRHLWQFRWVRDLGVIGLLVLVVWAAYSARAVVAPAMLGLVLAYVADPLVTWLAVRGRMGRAAATWVIIGVVIVLLAMVLTIIPFRVATQVESFLNSLPRYLDWIAQWLTQLGNAVAHHVQPVGGEAEQARPTFDWRQWIGSLKSSDIQQVGSGAVRAVGIGLGVAGTAIGFMTYLVVFTVVVVICFFSFSVRLRSIGNWFTGLIPLDVRPRAQEILTRMDLTISAFVRGRLVQSAVMATVLSVGWWIAGVPYWLLLGLAGGVLNLAPFLASLAFVAAVALNVIDGLSGGGAFTLWLVLWPALVYGIGQTLDGWVVEPLVQGKATNLDALTVLLAVLIGGSLAGLLGLIVAIPVTACIKIMMAEVVMPAYHRWADERKSARMA